MDIGKVVKDYIAKPVIVLVGAAAIVTGVFTGLNFYEHNNIRYKTDTKEVMQKADGVFGYTEIKLNKDGSREVARNSPFNYTSYKDKDGNGKVDEIWKQIPNQYSRGSHLGFLRRSENLNDYGVVFEKADNDFTHQMKRFGLK